MTAPHLRLVEGPATGWTTVAPNVQHTPAGGFRVRQRVGKRRVTIGVFATLNEALSVQQAARDEVGKRKGALRATLRSWMTTWLDRREADGVRSISSERNRAEKHVMTSRLSRIPLEDMHASDVRAWLRELAVKPVDLEGRRVGWSRKKAAEAKAAGKKPKARKKRPAPPGEKATPLSFQTRKHCLKLVRGALGAAVEEGMIDANPAVGIKLPKPTCTDEGSTVLTSAEQARLLAVVPEPARWIVAFAIGTGLRMGEQWSLELLDVHLDAEVPFVEVRYGAAGHKPTKSGKPRSVPLVGPALESARAWNDNLAGWCERINVLAWPTQRGFHRGKKPPRGWKAWLKAAGITRRVRWHDLRHTCASALVSGQWARRWSLEEVKAFLGHASIATTERYAKFAGDALMNAARETARAGEARPKSDTTMQEGSR